MWIVDRTIDLDDANIVLFVVLLCVESFVY